MASRDRFSFQFSCPACGQKGVIHWSENDYPFMTNNDRRLEEIDGNFFGSMIDEYDATICCKQCGHKFVK